MEAFDSIAQAVSNLGAQLRATSESESGKRRRVELEDDIATLVAAQDQALSLAALHLLVEHIAPALHGLHDSVDPRFTLLVDAARQQHTFADTTDTSSSSTARAGLLLGPLGRLLTTGQACGGAVSLPIPSYMSRPLSKVFPLPGPRGVRAVWLLTHRLGIPAPLLEATMDFWMCPPDARLTPSMPSSRLIIGCCFATRDEFAVRSSLDSVVARWLLSGTAIPTTPSPDQAHPSPAQSPHPHVHPTPLHFTLHSPFPANHGPGKPTPTDLIASGLLSMSRPIQPPSPL